MNIIDKLVVIELLGNGESVSNICLWFKLATQTIPKIERINPVDLTDNWEYT